MDAPLDHAPTSVCLAAERAFLARLDGSCRTPIAGLATLIDAAVHFAGEILLPDGTDSHATSRIAPVAAASKIGDDCAAILIAAAGPEFMRKLV